MQPSSVPSLRGIAAGSIPFQQLLNTCNSSSFVDSEICSWETWRERAYLQFAVPYEYFDLARTAYIPPTESSPGVPFRDISGSFRYLEIATKFKLIPESAVSLNKRTSTVSGIYESYAGVVEAVERNDIEGVDIFFPRLRNEQKKRIKKHIRYHEYWILSPPEFGFAAFEYLTRLLFGSEADRILTEGYSDYEHFWGDSDDVHRPPEWQIIVEKLEKNKADDGTRLVIGTNSSRDDFWEGLEYLISQGCRFALTQALTPNLQIPTRQTTKISSRRPTREEEIPSFEGIRTSEIFRAVLRSGQMDMLNRVLYFRRFLELPTVGNSVEEVLALGGDLNSTHQRSSIDRDYFRAACYSGNPLFVDFLLALHIDPFYRPDCWPINRGWYTRRNPVGYYQVLQKCDLEKAREEILKLGDIDMISYITEKIGEKVEWGEDEQGDEFEVDVLARNKGNVDILLTYLPLYQRTGNAAPLLESFDPSIYPLSTLLIKGAYSIN